MIHYILERISQIRYKTTLADKIKTLDDRANHAQYDLDREAAKSFAFTSKKYEYLISENLGYKLGGVEQAKFECSLLSQVFDKGLNEDGEFK